MKKIKLVLSIVITAAFLVACGSKQETVTICVGELSGLEGATGSAEYSAKGDSIYAYKTIQNIPIELFGELSKEEIEEQLDSTENAYVLSENVEYDFEVKDTEVVATIVLKDLSKATTSEFNFAGLSVTEGSRISLKETIKLQESSTNMTCTTNNK